MDAFHDNKPYIEDLMLHYQKGGLGDGTTKKILTECLQELIRPIREMRNEFISDKAQLIQIIKDGSEKANEEANRTLHEVKSSLGLNLF